MTGARGLGRAVLRSRWIWIALIAAASVGTTCWARRCYLADPFWSGYLANVAVTLALLAPGAWVLRRLEDVEQRAGSAVVAATGAQATAQAAAATASGAQADADAIAESFATRSGPLAAPSASELEQSVRAIRVAVVDERVAVFQRWAERCDRDSILEGMRLAHSLHLISRTGYRMPLWETPLHLRVLFDEEEGTLALRVEAADTTPAGPDVNWPPHRTAKDVCLEVDDLVDKAGRGLEPALPVSVRSLRAGALALAHAVRLQARAWAGGDMVGDIIEFIGSLDESPERDRDNDGWYLTDTAMFPMSRPIYRVPVGRIHEPFWRQHLADKTWGGNSGEALEVYRAILGVPDSD